MVTNNPDMAIYRSIIPYSSIEKYLVNKGSVIMANILCTADAMP